jgi:secreted PhoX family phosphatase
MTDRTPPVPTLGELIAQRLSRRAALRGSASAAASVLVGSSLLAACSSSDDTDSPSNPAPTVTATASPATVTSGNLVTVTGTATDDGTVASTSFTQVSGPAVSLSATTGTTTSFIVPGVTAATTIAIRFSATDNSGNTSTVDANVTVSPAALSFAAVGKTLADLVTVPAGYSVTPLYRTGDPITATAAAYANNGTDADFTARAGDNHAGFVYLGLVASGDGIDAVNSSRGLLAVNHQGINQAYLHPAGPTAPGGARPEAEVAKETAAHGIGVVELAVSSGAFAVVPASTYNRRVTPATPVSINGPVRGNAVVQTAFSADGTTGRGTIGNSGMVQTAWSTALSSEESWAPYFRRPAGTDNPRRTAKQIAALTRYGVNSDTGLYGWATVAPADASNTLYRRWDAQATGASATADFRNEPNQFGWVVEVDPYSAASTVRKRTALGRLAHSGITAAVNTTGLKPAFYIGDYGQNEYLYKFVSATAYVATDTTAADRMATGDKYLDTGTLYVAKFAADGTGTWVPLTFGTGGLDANNATFAFTDQADVLTHARIAGDILAATPMDRPDRISVNPGTGEVYVALNGNDARAPGAVNAPNPRAYVDPPSATVGNRNGHVIRLAETGTSEATAFTWDIYVLGAGADLDATNINASALDASNDFSGPEELRFGRGSNPSGAGRPVLWIGTDDQAYRDVTNNQLLASLPGGRGDGADKTITNAGGGTQATKLGKAPGALLKRFLVAPVGAAVTGVDSTPDGRTLFVSIQHPGEGGSANAPTSNWPANQGSAAPGARPRSATVVIRRTDGGIVGL